jgi:hypothetical protein
VPVRGWAVFPWVSPQRELLCVRFRKPHGSKKLCPTRPDGCHALYPRPGLLKHPGAPEGRRLWVVEGETDGLTVLDCDSAASVWLLPTARGWRTEWCRLLASVGEVVVALDCDPAGAAGESKVLRDLHRWRSEQARSLRIARAVLHPGEDLCDAVTRLRREEGK